MRSLIFLLLLGMAAPAGRLHAQTDSFYVQGKTSLHARYPGRVTAGESVEISCRPDSALRGPLRVVLYVYDTTYQWRVIEYRLAVPHAGRWSVRLAIPGDAGFVAYKFLEGSHADNNGDNGYFSIVYRSSSAYRPGAEEIGRAHV